MAEPPTTREASPNGFLMLSNATDPTARMGSINASLHVLAYQRSKFTLEVRRV